MEPELGQYNYIFRLPRDVQRLALIKLDYDTIVGLCKFKELSYICNDVDFWYQKIESVGVNKGLFLRYTNLRASDRYLLFKLLSEVTDNSQLPSYLDKYNLIIDNSMMSVLIIAARMGYTALKLYILKRYDYLPLKLLLAITSANDTPTALKLIVNLGSYSPNDRFIINEILSIAARKGNITIITLIYNKYKDSDLSFSLYKDPLIISIKYNQIEIVRVILPKVTLLEKSVDSLIEDAIESLHTDIAILLINTYKDKYLLKYNKYIAISTDSRNYDFFIYILNNYEINPNEVLDYLIDNRREESINVDKIDERMIEELVNRGATNIDDVVSVVVFMDPTDPIVLATARFLASRAGHLTQETIDSLQDLMNNLRKDNPDIEPTDYVGVFTRIFSVK